MGKVGQQVPILFPFFAPFPQLAELISHEVQFFARMYHHIQVECAGLREFIFVLPVHFLQDRRLPMHDFVMGEGKHVFLLVIVHHREGQLMILSGPRRGRHLEILQRIMHPSHIPLIIEAESAPVYLKGNIRVAG